MNTDLSSGPIQMSNRQNVWASRVLMVFAFGAAIGFALKNILIILGSCIALGGVLGYLLGRRIKENRINRKQLHTTEFK